MQPGTCIRILAMSLDGTGFEAAYQRMEFSGGEVQVRLTSPELLSRVCMVNLHANLRSSNDLMELLLLTDALRRHVPTLAPINLVCPYLPYARQDRVCAPGEALSLRVVCDLINAQKYSGVQVWDVHSPTSLALLNNVMNVPAAHLMPAEIARGSLLIAPDAGAIKRVEAVAKEFDCPMVVAEKHRDPNDGKLSGTRCHIPEELQGMDVLIVDDICDGGRTFVALTKAMLLDSSEEPPKSVNLWVTHGIFSAGFEELGQWINNIYTPNPFPSDLPEFVHKV